jgi:hypothetical protein
MDVIKDDFGGKLPSGRPIRPDVRARPHLPRGRDFTSGRVFTVRRRGKNRIRADALPSARTQKKKLKLKFFFGSSCRLGKRNFFFNFQFSIFNF